MPPTILPPTPVSSTNLKPQLASTAATFDLLPPAMTNLNPPSPIDEPIDTSHSVTSSASSYQPSPPTSPAHKSQPRKRTLSGATKNKPSITQQQLDLPPPPQRARKIIQMTPKLEPQTSTPPTTSPSGSAKGKTKRKLASSTTTAAGRRIARKTAHSIIERRRRSKMNEEFGVLKDMIPACQGQEMHKLAILQAGIEYVRWLERVVAEMKRDKQQQQHQQQQTTSAAKRSREEDEDDMSFYRKASVISDASPEFGPVRVGQSASTIYRSQHHTSSYESLHTPSTAVPTPQIIPTPTLLSPAFGGLHFSSPEMARRSPAGNNVGVVTKGGTTPSPHILPMPPAMMELDSARVDELRSQQDPAGRTGTPDQEATATAALMMLTHHDRRHSLSRYKIGRSPAGGGVPLTVAGESTSVSAGDVEKEGVSINVKAMSVRDLLST